MGFIFLVQIRWLLMVISIAIIIAAILQCSLLPYKIVFPHSPDNEGFISRALLISNATVSHSFRLNPNDMSSGAANGTYSSSVDEESGDDNETKDHLNRDIVLSLTMDPIHGKDSSFPRAISGENEHGNVNQQAEEADIGSTLEGVRERDGVVSLVLPRTSGSLFASNVTSAGSIMKVAKTLSESTASVALYHNRLNGSISVSSLKRQQERPRISISEMNSFLLKSHGSSHYARPQRSSVRDRELLSAKLKIEKAPVVRNYPGLHGSAFRNLSRFIRSYELMERMLKIYIYKEGEKPIFHQSKMRGIYASEGWLMKLLEGNKRFVVRDPRKAHLFYLPFSPQMLRTVLFGQKFHSQKDLEVFLKNYVDLVAHKYSFWNRTGGADHFLVGCHDWATRITRQHMKNCIRVLCNANVAKGFKIGQDSTLPVTYIRSAENPQQDLGGRPHSERSILAFFAGGMHGYLRPILLQHWENTEPDMKITGPMPRDIEGKKLYREYMKSSRYCICARGYEVHTPRIVEAISYGCVPVIISDNYVPPFFEVMNWEAFSVFVEEKEIPNLRNILVSIPEEKYIEMQSSVKMVQQHFLWHKIPVKYDLFHMILHSVWYNRIFQMHS